MELHGRKDSGHADAVRQGRRSGWPCQHLECHSGRLRRLVDGESRFDLSAAGWALGILSAELSWAGFHAD
jgi:hypothetical protein